MSTVWLWRCVSRVIIYYYLSYRNDFCFCVCSFCFVCCRTGERCCCSATLRISWILIHISYKLKCLNGTVQRSSIIFISSQVFKCYIELSHTTQTHARTDGCTDAHEITTLTTSNHRQRYHNCTMANTSLDYRVTLLMATCKCCVVEHGKLVDSLHTHTHTCPIHSCANTNQCSKDTY